MSIGQFLTSKAESCGLKAESLAKQCKIGQATMYRYIRGENSIPPIVERMLADILQLNDVEKREFHKMIERSTHQKPMRKAFRVLDMMVFGEKPEKTNIPRNDKVVFLETDRYLMTTQEMHKRLLRNVDALNFRCSLRVLGNLSELHLHDAIGFIKNLFSIAKNVTVEHFIPISAKDYADSVQVLIEALPLLKHKRYKLFYIESDSKENVIGLLSWSFYFSTSFTDEKGKPKSENFLGSLRGDGSIDCLSLNNPLMHEFLTNEFFMLQSKYKKNFMESRLSDAGINFLVSMEQKYPLICIKPDLNLVRFSLAVHQNMINRLSFEEKHILAEGFSERALAHEEVEGEILRFQSVVEARSRASIVHQHTDIVSKAGLLELVKSGRLFNHFDWMPSFNKEELRYVMEYIRDRNIDETDPYKLYITDKPIIENEYHVFIYKEMGVLFYFADPPRILVSNNMCIESVWLANLFSEYAESFIPSNYALSEEETTEYLNSLIDKYLV